jgi:hypothetical protein
MKREKDNIILTKKEATKIAEALNAAYSSELSLVRPKKTNLDSFTLYADNLYDLLNKDK